MTDRPTVEGVSEWKKYQRLGEVEARPWTAAEAKEWRETAKSLVSINDVDLVLAGMPDPVGMVARNPANHTDQWYIAPKYFAAHYTSQPSQGKCERCDGSGFERVDTEDGLVTIHCRKCGGTYIWA